MQEIHAIGFSGGKDSTALLVRMLELNQNQEIKYHVLITPTGDEPPDMVQRWRWLLRAADKEMTKQREEKTGCRVCSL